MFGLMPKDLIEQVVSYAIASLVTGTDAGPGEELADFLAGGVGAALLAAQTEFLGDKARVVPDSFFEGMVAKWTAGVRASLPTDMDRERFADIAAEDAAAFRAAYPEDSEMSRIVDRALVAYLGSLPPAGVES